MGAAGDMLQAALYELLSEDDKKKYISEMNDSGVKGVTVSANPDVKRGITGTHMSVEIDGVEEESHDHHHEHDHEHHHDHHEHDHEHHHEHDHEHHHEHDHEHHHHHSSLADVHEIINATAFSDKVKVDACAIYDRIAQAESKAHGKDVSEIHFHEVGMKDAIADIIGVCRLIEMIGPDYIYASPVRTGFGEVHCAHGIVPVPAPATAFLLKDIPVYAGDIRGEMCTPTGAAILAYYTDKFMQMPTMKIQSVGYGMGKKDFEQTNCVRAYLGENDDSADSIIKLACNIDDMTGEEIGFAFDIFEASKALDVYTIPVTTKKNRPGYIFTVLCKKEDEKDIVSLMFKHTTTLGIRRSEIDRYVLERKIEKKDTKLGSIRIKNSFGYDSAISKYEYDDIARIAKENNISFREARNAIIND